MTGAALLIALGLVGVGLAIFNYITRKADDDHRSLYGPPPNQPKEK